jgi:hypothetical protein
VLEIINILIVDEKMINSFLIIFTKATPVRAVS